MALEDAICHLPNIAAMGDRIFEPRWAESSHCTISCELLYVVAGSVRTVLRNRRKIQAAAGNVVVIPPGMWHRDEFDLREGLKVFMVTFHWRDAGEYFKRLPRPFAPVLDMAARHAMESHVAHLRRLLHSGLERDRLLARAVLAHLLLTLLHAHHGQQSPPSRRNGVTSRRRHELMRQARRYIETHYTGEISLEHIARTLAISPFYLSHLFSQESNFSLTEYLTRLRMQQAKLLLQTGRHSIKEAAHAVGFKDSSYFTKVFRRYFGFAPRELRAALRQ